ncbi:MAG: ATP-binding cassette domain-containing protein, partial [Flavobacteriales bacterium]
RDSPIIYNASLHINSKSRILIFGESGAGKSTLLRLIAGIIEPTAGYIYINNLSVNSLNLNHYRAHLGLSLTEESPFDGTIKENLTFGNPNISDNDIFDVLNKIGLMDFVKEQPKGLQTILNADGKQMSHTVSKKIILARAILKNPKVLILEDALDRFNPTETNAIINYLTHPDRPWALIVVSVNESWKSKCSQIIQLEKGEIKNIDHA